MNVPQLRFEGFNGEWEVHKLKEVTEIIGDGMHSTPTYDEDGMYFFANGSNIQDGKVVFFSDNKKVNYGEFIKYRNKLKQNSILVSLNGATWGRFGRYNDENILLGKSLGFINPIDTIERDYLYYILQTNIVRKYFESVTTGSTIKNLSLDTLRNTQLRIPVKAEQKKIASFLMLVEKKIEKQQEKVEKLKQFKKGMMQKVFSQELRFKDEDGGEFPEWEEKKLDKCLEIENGFPFKSSCFTTEPLGMPLLRIRDIKAEKLNTYYTGSFDEKYLVDNEDIVIGMDGEFAVSKWKKGPALLNQRVMRIKSKKDNSLSYLYQLLKIVVQKIEDITPQTTVKHLSNKDIFNSIVKIPNFDEQQKIGNFFLNIDTKIEKEKEKLIVLEEQKRGLMQGMFV